jgi:hypothetical protein
MTEFFSNECIASAIHWEKNMASAAVIEQCRGELAKFEERVVANAIHTIHVDDQARIDKLLAQPDVGQALYWVYELEKAKEADFEDPFVVQRELRRIHKIRSHQQQIRSTQQQLAVVLFAALTLHPVVLWVFA